VAGRLIGDAYVVIYPQTDQFGPQARVQLDEALAKLKPTVDVRPKLDKAATAAVDAELKGLTENVQLGISPAQLAALRASVNAALKGAGGNVGVNINPAELAAVRAGVNSVLNGQQSPVNLNNREAMASLADVAARTEDIRRALESLRARVDDTDADAKLARLQVQAAALDKELETAPSDAEWAPFEARILAIQAAYERIASARLGLDDTQALAQLQGLADRAGQLRIDLQNLRANVSDTAAAAKIAALEAQAVKLSRSLTFAPATADLAPFEAQLLGIAAAYEQIKTAQSAESAELTKQVTIWNRLGLAGAGSLTSLREVVNAATSGTNGIRLFGGALDMMYAKVTGDKLPALASHLVSVATATHLAVEAVVEFAAIWVPATIALAAFGAAATPTVIAIGKQLQNMNIAATGTGRSFDSLAMSGQSVVKAVQPTVLEAFGIGLFALQNHASGLAGVMHTLGQGIDQFAAKAAIAFDSSSGNKFFTQGSKDALALLDSFQQLGSILGTLIKVVPGYAEVLLSFGNSLLAIAADAVKVAEPVLQIGVALHGALFYGGLVGTAVALSFSKIVAGVTVATEAVAGWAAANLAADSAVTGGLGTVLRGLDALSAAPVIAGVGLVAGALAALAIYLKASGDAAKGFNAEMQKTVTSANVLKLPATLASALAQTNAKLAGSYADVATAQAHAATSAGDVQFRYSGVTTAVQAAKTASGEYMAGQQQLSAESQHLNLNLAAIAATFGTSIPGALELANAAQVTSDQLISSGARNWAVISTMVAGYVAQLRAIVPGTGQLNQALNALNVTQSQQVQDAQKIAQAYQSWIGIVTGGDSAFTTFEQGQQTLATALNSASSSAVTYTDKLGKLEVKGTTAGASLNGLSQASLNARQAFDSQITAATTLYGNLQTMATVSGTTTAAQNQLAAAGKDLIAQLLPMAAGSKQATAEVFALAQIVGYAGSNSFPALAQWVGSTKNAESDLNSQQIALTLSSANLTQAAKNLAVAMSSEVAQGEAAAIAKTSDLTGLQGQLATAVENASGKVSAAATTLAGQYYEALIKAGEGANTAQQDVDAFLQKLGATPDDVDKVNKALASLPKTVNTKVNVDTSGATAAVNSLQSLINSLHGTNLTVTGGTADFPVVKQASAAGGIVHAAGGRMVRGSGPSGRDGTLIMAAPGELVIPTSHAPAFRDMARKASIPGFDGGGTPAPVYGFGNFAGMPYSYASSSPYQVVPEGAAGTQSAQMPGMTTYQAAQLITLMEQQNKLLAQMPYTQAQAINQAQSAGVRRGWFATSG
jgi:hypothetical protein